MSDRLPRDPARPAQQRTRVRMPRRRPGRWGLLGLAVAVAACVAGGALEAGVAARVARRSDRLLAVARGGEAAAERQAEVARLEATRASLAAGIRGVTLLLAAFGFAIGGGGLFSHLSARVGRRRREFGLRLGAGASRAELLCEVLAEAAGGALAGGFLGLLAGRLGAWALGALTDFPARPPLPPALGGLGLALLLGLLVGLHPAWRAMRQPPIVPLRPVPRGKPAGR